MHNADELAAHPHDHSHPCDGSGDAPVLADAVTGWASTLMSLVPLTGRATSLSLATRYSQVASMPFFRLMGLAPAVTAWCTPTMFLSLLLLTQGSHSNGGTRRTGL